MGKMPLFPRLSSCVAFRPACLGFLPGLLALALSFSNARAEPPTPMEYGQITRPSSEITAKEKGINFGLLYTAQWASYFITQPSAIRDHGSFKNWHTNMLKPHFDKDGIGYNIRNHAIVGNYYYNFFRSRGYDRRVRVHD
jgi:hypothetical protein